MNASIPVILLGTLLTALGPAQRTSDSREVVPGRGAVGPASLAFGDFDGDRLLDVLAIGPEGTLRLMRNLGDGAFDDVSAFAGLGEVRGASLVLWEDYDRDGRLDLFVASACGARYLFHNEGASRFLDVAAASGLGGEGCGEQGAQWLDYDQDGRLDLHLEGTAGGRLYHSLADGSFEERVLVGGGAATTAGGPLVLSASSSTTTVVDVRSADTERESVSNDGTIRLPAASSSGPRTVLPASPTSAGTQPLRTLPTTCVASIRDQANPGHCLQATSVPSPGMLFPPPHDGGVNNVSSGTNSFIGGGQDNQATNGGGILGTRGHTTIGGGRNNVASGNYATVGGGGGVGNLGNTASADWSTVSGGRKNVASGRYATVGGGHSNTASDFYATVSGGLGNAAGFKATVSGGVDNIASGAGSTVGGGGTVGDTCPGGCSIFGGNTASGLSSTVSGGYLNTASGNGSTVSGGQGNGASGYCATVGGGGGNICVYYPDVGTFCFKAGNSASGEVATVGGGGHNVASGDGSTVSGGGGQISVFGPFLGNTAAGVAATVPGGRLNTALGDYSFAAGRRAKANHAGAFVWGDSQDVDKTSSAADEFNVYAEAGVRIFAAGTSSPSLVVDGAGNVGIGTSAPSEELTVSGDICATGTIGACSDARFKTAVEPVTGALALVRELRAVRFDWDRERFPERRFSDQRQLGFLAQELAELVPEVVSRGSDGFYSVDYGKLTPLLVRAIQEQEDELAARSSELADLREANSTLEARVARLESLGVELAGLEVRLQALGGLR